MDTRSLRRRVAIVGALAIGVVIVHAACGGSSVPVTPKYPYWLIGSSASPSGGGTESLDPDGTTDSTGVTSYFCSMTKDLIVEITAHPAEGYVFDHWGMDCKGTSLATTLSFNSSTCKPGVPSVKFQCQAVYAPVGSDLGARADLGAAPGCGDMVCDVIPATTRITGWKSTSTGAAADDDYIIVGSGDQLATSADGITWTKGSFGAITGNDYSGVAASSTATNKYVAVGGIAGVGGGAYYSPDAVSWTKATGPTAALDVTWDGARYLTAGAGEICTSSDGATWSCANPAPLAGFYVTRIVYTGSAYVAVGGDGSNHPMAATSPDAVTWTVQASAAAATAQKLCGVAFANNLLVAGTDGFPDGGEIITSSDSGVTWTARPSAKTAEKAFAATGSLCAIGWTGTWWTASGFTIVSANGLDWRAGDPLSGGSALAMTTAGPRGAVALTPQGTVLTIEK